MHYGMISCPNCCDRAETQAKLKLEKVNEMKKIIAVTMATKLDISKYGRQLKEYQLYQHFLDALTPHVRIFFNEDCRCVFV